MADEYDEKLADDSTQSAHPAARYERKDIRFRALMLLVIVVCCYLPVHYGLVWRLLYWGAQAEDLAKRSDYAGATPLATPLPPAPRLEQIDRLSPANPQVAEELAAKQRALHSFGPSDEKEFVHIPIERAIEAVAGTLPVAKEPPADSEHGNGLLEGGESNSGRMYRGAK